VITPCKIPLIPRFLSQLLRRFTPAAKSAQPNSPTFSQNSILKGVPLDPYFPAHSNCTGFKFALALSGIFGRHHFILSLFGSNSSSTLLCTSSLSTPSAQYFDPPSRYSLPGFCQTQNSSPFPAQRRQPGVNSRRLVRGFFEEKEQRSPKIEHWRQGSLVGVSLLAMSCSGVSLS